MYNVWWKGGDRNMFPNDKYFELYGTLLKVVHEKDIEDTEELIAAMQETPVIKDNINEIGSKVLIKETFRTMDNLIADGLIKGKKQEFYHGTEYMLDGLTTTGHTYLSSIENDTTWNKIKDYIKSEGIPTTPQTITKAIANVVLK